MFVKFENLKKILYNIMREIIMREKLKLSEIFKKNKVNKEHLYDYTPPSLTWRKKVDFIKAGHSKFWRIPWMIYVKKTLLARFASIRVKNVEAIYNVKNDYPMIFIAQHNNWFDGMLGWYLCDEMLNMKMNIMVEDLAKFPLLSQVGAFSVSKKSPKTILKALNYSVDFLAKKEAVLYMFPQGIINPPNHRPLNFTHGVSYIAKKLGKANIFLVAPKYTYLRLGIPEILVDISEPIILNEDNQFATKEDLTKHLEEEYIKLLDNQEVVISNGKIDEYEIFYKKPDGWSKRIEKWFKSRF